MDSNPLTSVSTVDVTSPFCPPASPVDHPWFTRVGPARVETNRLSYF